ncbi:hypothetical protein MES5069_520162 [Mesorhizobium escarrei]|uniref:Uncharacterized protein n=1 Tax=Mesorhizobium escarrei TaxID=666018 RepID=A0ABN8KAB1_9HYPH|nr:hypothetical protein MES5069_520162 [Mesorhizobium escarrei]
MSVAPIGYSTNWDGPSFGCSILMLRVVVSEIELDFAISASICMENLVARTCHRSRGIHRQSCLPPPPEQGGSGRRRRQHERLLRP